MLRATLLVVFFVGASRVDGQGCHGTPARGGLALEHGGLSIGTSEGANVAFAGHRAAFGATYRYRDIGPRLNGHEGAVRFSLILGASRLQLCPTLGLGYQRDTWTVNDSTSIISNRLAPRGGLQAGIDFSIGESVVVTPFAGAQYEYAVVDFEAASGSGETNVTGDTLSQVDFEYGAIIRYRRIFAGVIANQYSGLERPYMGRLVLGVAFGRASEASARARQPQARTSSGLTKPRGE
jgi:hypothetical protein